MRAAVVPVVKVLVYSFGRKLINKKNPRKEDFSVRFGKVPVCFDANILKKTSGRLLFKQIIN